MTALGTIPGIGSRGIRVGDVMKFDGKRSRWLVRAKTKSTRYALLTNKVSNRVYYTIVDFKDRFRGPMNIIGGGLGIFTTSGPDEHIAEAIKMLEAKNECWEISFRNRVPLNVTEVLRAKDRL